MVKLKASEKSDGKGSVSAFEIPIPIFNFCTQRLAT